MSLNVELTSKEINNEVCLNLLKMLYRRKLIDDVETKFNEISNDIIDKAIIEFELNNKTKCSIYIINVKLTSISQNTPIDDYLSNNINIHKIVILKDAAKKVLKQIIYEYKNAEFFFEHEMLEDKPVYIKVPQHILLNEEEKIELLDIYDEYQLKIIYDTDMMSRYYGAKIGDIFKIVGTSASSGISISFRRVYHGSLDIILP
jgi:DNA-directed RNA polymerase subunit H (RpoH/RPB5)